MYNLFLLLSYKMFSVLSKLMNKMQTQNEIIKFYYKRLQTILQELKKYIYLKLLHF